MTHLKLKTKHKNMNFNNSLKLTKVVFFITLLVLTSCGGSDDSLAQADCAGGLWTQSIQTELNAWSAAIQAYSANPSSSNCQKYKSTGQDYINALDRVKACVPNQSLNEFENSLKEARTQISDISC